MSIFLVQSPRRANIITVALVRNKPQHVTVCYKPYLLFLLSSNKGKCHFTVEGSGYHPHNPVLSFRTTNGGTIRYSASPIVIQCAVHVTS